MNLVENEMVSTTATQEVSEEDPAGEKRSYREYLEGIARDIPDVWDVTEHNRVKIQDCNIHFEKVPSRHKWCMKAFVHNEIYRRGISGATARSTFIDVVGYLEIAESKHGGDCLSGWNDFVETLGRRIRQKITKSDHDRKLEVSSARNKAHSVENFLLFVSVFDEAFEWVHTISLDELLPTILKKYFSDAELKRFRSEFRKLRNQNKTKAIPYDELIKIMRFVRSLPPSYIKTAIVLAAHTGLRISEILLLKKNCMQPVSDTEIKAAREYIKALEGASGVIPDWSESAWLMGHQVLKGEGLDFREGAPILVSKHVVEVIEELKELTKELRKESGSDNLFLNRNGGRIRIRSITSMYSDKKELARKGMPFVGFHQFRATFATILYDLSVPIPLIEKYLNHISSDVTAGYIATHKERRSELMQSIMDDGLIGAEVEGGFFEEFKGICTSSEWPGMTYGVQLQLFEHLMKKHEIKIEYSDHGHCVLPAEEICPHGFDGVKPCHTSMCEKFKPDPDERPFFVSLLDGREKARKEIAAFAFEHGDASVNWESFDNDSMSIANIINIIDQVG